MSCLGRILRVGSVMCFGVCEVMTGIGKEYVRSLIGEVNEGLEKVREIIAMSLDEFIRGRSMRFATGYSIVLIVEAAADLGLMILKRCFDEEAGSCREVFMKLAERGVVSFDVAEGMASLASLRNMVVHRYWSVGNAGIYREARDGGVGIVRRFVGEVEGYVSKDP